MPIRKAIAVKTLVAFLHLSTFESEPDLNQKPSEPLILEKKCRNFGGAEAVCTQQIARILKENVCVKDMSIYFEGRKSLIQNRAVVADLEFELYMLENRHYLLHIESADGIYANKALRECLDE